MNPYKFALLLYLVIGLILCATVWVQKVWPEQMYLDPECKFPFSNEPINPVLILYRKSQIEEIRWDDLVATVIQIESSGNPQAVSKAGCIGLMQINPKGALAEWNNAMDKRYKMLEKGHPFPIDYDWIKSKCSFHTLGDLYNPNINIKIGTWYLKRLKDHYLKNNFTIERMLAAYNGGPTRMRRLLRQGKDWQDMPRESVNYVRKVLKLYRRPAK